MTSSSSVTNWLFRLREGDPDGANALFRTYFPRLARLAQERLRSDLRAAHDGEDVALAALDSFFRGAQAGRFPDLNDRNDLWRLLLTMTLCKVRDLSRRATAGRRGGGRRTAELSDLFDEPADLLDRLAGPDPPPDQAASFAEQCRLYLGLLDDGLRSLALERLEGHSIEEMADRRGVARRTVLRKLALIRQVWQEEGPDREAAVT